MEKERSKLDLQHWSYPWLAIGLVFLIFSNGIFRIIPLATWLAPVFLIRFLRTQSKTKGLLFLAPVHIGAWIIMVYGVYPGEVEVSVITGLAYGIVLFLPFLIDRAISPRIKGFISTLVFPFSWVTIEYFLSLSPTQSWFSLAYTQHDNLALIQLVSITGIWGLSFLITWFASVVNWAWEQEFSLPVTWKGVSLYLGILAFIALLGGAYLIFLPADSDTVRAAAITRSFDIDEEVINCKESVPEEDFDDCILEMQKRSLAEFLEDSRQAANAGAKLIVWQENGIAVERADEANSIEQGWQFAMGGNVYLLMGVKMSAEEKTSDENKVVLITPSGEVSEYLKNFRVQGDYHILGSGEVLVQDSNYGKLATIICQDTHAPRFVRKAGKVNADIILIPNHNWESITPMAARMAHFRAIENGFSMIRADYHGLSTAVDYHGNILSQMNDFTTKERIMIADIPMQGINTIYSLVGDVFAWLSGLGLLVMFWLSLSKSKKERAPE